MRTPRKARRGQQASQSNRYTSKARLGILLGVVVAASILIASLGSGAPVSAAGGYQSEQAKNKRYKATRPFVVDKQTGQVRMPTQQEVDQVVANLSDLGQRPAETLPQTTSADGTVVVDLDGAFGGVLLGRPNEDGSVGDEVCVHGRRGCRIPRARRRRAGAMRVDASMTHNPFSQPFRSALIALACLVVTAGAVSAGPAQFVIVNLNAPGVGFNDPTPVAPVGGNTGTTLGQQRLIAFEHAAQIWSARLDSAVPIRIRAQFTSLAPGRTRKRRACLGRPQLCERATA